MREITLIVPLMAVMSPVIAIISVVMSVIVALAIGSPFLASARAPRGQPFTVKRDMMTAIYMIR
jgi:hypothetical protein